MKAILMEEPQKSLYAFIEKTIFGDHQIKALPSQGNKVKIQQPGDGMDAQSSIRASGQNIEAYI